MALLSGIHTLFQATTNTVTPSTSPVRTAAIIWDFRMLSIRAKKAAKKKKSSRVSDSERTCLQFSTSHKYVTMDWNLHNYSEQAGFGLNTVNTLFNF